MSTITMTNIDPGEGASLQADNYLAVYGGMSLLDMFYPVGSSYKTHDINFDPNVSWGGVWVEDTDYVLCAYCKVDGTTIKASKNISSFTRGQTGVFTVGLSTPMQDVDGIIEVSAETEEAGYEILATYWNSVSTFTVDCSNHAGTLVNPLYWFINVYGRLATPEYRIWKRTA